MTGTTSGTAPTITMSGNGARVDRDDDLAAGIRRISLFVVSHRGDGSGRHHDDQPSMTLFGYPFFQITGSTSEVGGCVRPTPNNSGIASRARLR
jgi:hypothetical protein